ncbi:MAG: methyltransferase domain-containing protein [Myxococcales bacterium]|nr:methyltransferase domain-containing protein [Myxococcales bacterium]
MQATHEPMDHPLHTSAGPRVQTDEEQAYYALNERVYRWFAPVYDLVTAPLAGLRREVAELVGAGAGMRILDVATGSGAQAFAFATRGAEVVGIDLSEAMLRIARRKNRHPRLTFHRADAVALPFPNASFDVACISFALHEMPRSVRNAAMMELVRVIKPGGSVVVVDYALPRHPLSRSIVFHVVKLYETASYIDFVHSDVRELLTTAGFAAHEGLPRLLGAAKVWTGLKPAG